MKLSRAAVNKYRARQGLTLEALAERVGVKRDALQRWLAGTRWPSAAHLEALGRELKVDSIKLIEKGEKQ